MIVIVCKSCGLALRTAGEDAESLLGKPCEWYPDCYPCPSCGSKAALIDDKEAKSYVVRDLTPQEVLVAFHGLGMPEEQECGSAAVYTALCGEQIGRIRTRQIRPGRCCLDFIELESGTRLYLGSSPHGAVVYRIAGAHSYTRAVETELGI